MLNWRPKIGQRKILLYACHAENSLGIQRLQTELMQENESVDLDDNIYIWT